MTERSLYLIRSFILCSDVDNTVCTDPKTIADKFNEFFAVT